MDELAIGSEQDFKNHNDLPLARIKRIMKVRRRSFAAAAPHACATLWIDEWGGGPRRKTRTPPSISPSPPPRRLPPSDRPRLPTSTLPTRRARASSSFSDSRSPATIVRARAPRPLAQSDEDVRMISAEAPVLFAKACEMFILELTLRSWCYSEQNKRRTLQKASRARERRVSTAKHRRCASDCDE